MASTTVARSISLFDGLLGLFGNSLLLGGDFSHGFDLLGDDVHLFVTAGDINHIIIRLLDVKFRVDATSFASRSTTLSTRLAEAQEFFLSLFLLEDVSFDLGIGDEIHALTQLVFGGRPLLALCFVHASLEESLLARGFNFVDALHGLHGLDHEISIIARWDIALLLELKHGVVGHLLAVGHAVSLGPLELARVLLRLEQLVALAGAEAEQFRVIAHEGCPVTRVHVARTEIALVNSHL